MGQLRVFHGFGKETWLKMYFANTKSSLFLRTEHLFSLVGEGKAEVLCATSEKNVISVLGLASSAVSSDGSTICHTVRREGGRAICYSLHYTIPT